MILNNYYEDDEDVRYEFPLYFEMGNSIVYGSATEEFSTSLSGAEVDTTYLFDHCLMKTEKGGNNPACFSNCLFNQDPLFVDYRLFDLHLSDALSPAVGSGSPVISTYVPYDLEGKSRNTTPDLGAYQLE